MSGGSVGLSLDSQDVPVEGLEMSASATTTRPTPPRWSACSTPMRATRRAAANRFAISPATIWSDSSPRGPSSSACWPSTARTPVGLVNAIEGFSTFACRPLVNVHDVVVLPGHRGRGIAARLFAEVEAIARERGACKLTLEVLDGNTPGPAPVSAAGLHRLPTRPRDGPRAVSAEMAGLKHALFAWCWSHGRWLATRHGATTPPAAPAMLLAEVYAADVDVTRYWVSEKFDGVRAQWDGQHAALSRRRHRPGTGVVHRELPGGAAGRRTVDRPRPVRCAVGNGAQTRTGGCRMATGALPDFRIARRGGRLQRTRPADAARWLPTPPCPGCRSSSRRAWPTAPR